MLWAPNLWAITKAQGQIAEKHRQGSGHTRSRAKRNKNLQDDHQGDWLIEHYGKLMACPTKAHWSAHGSSPTSTADIFAWRQLAWDNAQRLLSAPTPKARDAIAKEIRKHARDKAREIIRWYR